MSIASALARLAGKGVAKSFGQIKPPSRRGELPGLVDDTTSASPVKPPLQERGLPGLVDEMAPTSQVKLDSPEVLPLGKKYLDSEDIDPSKNTYEALGRSEEEILEHRDVNLPKSLKRDRHRNKTIEEAAKELDEGNISLEDFIRIKNQEKPLQVYQTIPKVDTPLDVASSLNKKQRETPIVGLNKEIKEGEKVSSRFDINAYSSYDVYVATINKISKDGKSRLHAYSPTAALKDVSFKNNAKKSFKIASGGPKSPFATMEGTWRNIKPETLQADAQKLLDGGNINKLGEADKDKWTEIGFDPAARLSFYNRSTGDPIFKADEVIQIGPMILAKGIKKATPDELKKLNIKTKAGEEITYKNRGGSVMERNPYNYQPKAI